MATVFNQIEDLLNKRKQDVLASKGQPTGGPESNTIDNPGMSSTQSSGFAGGNQGQANTAAGAKFSSKPQDLQKVMDANKDFVKTDIAAKTSDSIKNSQASLQSQADNFIKNASQTAEKFRVNDYDVSNSDTFNKLGERLSKQWSDSDFGSFNPQISETFDIEALVDPTKRQAKMNQSFNEQSGGKYTAGMSRLDSMLLDKSGFDYSDALRANQDFQAQKAKVNRDISNVKAREQAEFAADTAALKQRLSDGASSINKAVNQRFEADSAAVTADLQQKTKAAIDNQLADLNFGALRSQLESKRVTVSPDNPYFEEDAATIGQLNAGIDANLKRISELENSVRSGGYIQAQGPSRVKENYARAEEADQFNKIMQLLGQGDTLQALAGNVRGSVSTKDVGSVMKGIQDAVSKIQYTPIPKSLATIAAEKAPQQAAARALPTVNGVPTDPTAPGPKTTNINGGKPMLGENDLNNIKQAAKDTVSVSGRVGAAVLTGGLSEAKPNTVVGKATSGVKNAAKSAAKSTAKGIKNAAKKIFSDEDVKENIHGMPVSQLDDLLNNLEAKTFEYTDPKYGKPGKHVGVMAQDLEKSDLGKQSVSETEEGVKQVDIADLFPKLLASVVMLNKKVKDMEGK